MAQSNLKVARPMTAVTPIHSSLAGLLRDYLLRLFPASYFRDQFINTELAFRPGQWGNRRTRFRPMEGSNAQQMKYPMLSIRVTPSADVSPLGTLDSYWQGRKFLRRGGLYHIFYDDQGLRALDYERERVICRFDVSMLTQTDLQAHEVLAFLKRSMPIDRTVYLRGSAFWCKIPQEIIRDVYEDLGLPAAGGAGAMAQLATYLGQMSAGRIQQTVDSATGRVTYSFPYTANPLFRVQGTPSLAPNRDGNVIRSAEVSFSVEMDLEAPNAFVYQQEPRLYPGAGVPNQISSDGQTAYFGITVDIAPPNVMNETLRLVYRAEVVTSSPDPNNYGAPDVTPLGPTIQPELAAYISSIVNGPVDPSTKLQIVLKVGPAVVPSGGYSMNWDTWEFSILPPNLVYDQGYLLLIYADLGDYAGSVPDNTGRRQAPSPFYTLPAGAPQGGSP